MGDLAGGAKHFIAEGLCAKNSSGKGAAVNTYSDLHIVPLWMRLVLTVDDFKHHVAEVDNKLCMIVNGDGQTANCPVSIPNCLYFFNLVFHCCPIELDAKDIEHRNDLLGCPLGTPASEADNITEEDSGAVGEVQHWFVVR